MKRISMNRASKSLKQKWYEVPPVQLEDSKLVKFVREASKSVENFNAVIIGGKKGRGKSTLALWLSYYVYNDWNKALDHVQFDPARIVEIFKKAHRNDEFVPLLVWDDAAAYLRYAPGTYYSYVMEQLKSLYETIRIICPLIIFTAASPQRLAPFVRDDPSIFVKVSRTGIAHVFHIRDGVNFKDVLKNSSYVRHIENIVFDRVPAEVYERYKVMRKEMAKTFIDLLDEERSSNLLTVREFASLLHVKPETVYVWIKKGILKDSVIKVLTSYRIDIDKAIEELDIKGSETIKKKLKRIEL